MTKLNTANDYALYRERQKQRQIEVQRIYDAQQLEARKAEYEKGRAKREARKLSAKAKKHAARLEAQGDRG